MPRSPLRPRSRLTNFASGVFAFAILVALVGGLPLALARFGGNPLPHHVPSWDAVRDALLRRDVTGSLFIRALDVTGWAAWASFTASVLLEIGARVRGRRTIRLPGLALQQRWAGGLLTAMALMVSSPAMASAAPLAAHIAKPAAVAVVAQAPTSQVSTAKSTPLAYTPLTYEVQCGDFLGSVAERFGGQFSDAEQLARDNNIANPDHIEAGWRITLPADAMDSGAHDHAKGTVLGRSDVAPDSTGTRTPGSAGGPTDGSAPHSGGSAPGRHGSGGSTTEAPVPNQNGASPALVEMLEASGTLAAVVALALIGIRHREQLQHRFLRRATMPGGAAPSRAMPGGAVLGSATSGSTVPGGGGVQPRLMAATRAGDIVRLDAALRVLAERVEDWPVEHIPQIAGVWLDQGTATLLFAEDCGEAPAPFVDDPNGWALPASAPLPYVAGQLAPLPSLCTVGGRPEQHILLDLEYLRMLGIGGDPGEALNLLRFIAIELCHNVWSDDVRVTLAGFGASESVLVSVDPDRIRTEPSVGAAIDRFSRRLAQAASAWDESWTPEVLLIANPTDADRNALAGLEQEMTSAPGVGMSVVVAPAASPIGRYHVEVSPAGDLHIGFLGDAVMPAASLPGSLLAEVVKLLADARASGATGPVDLARAASRAVLMDRGGTRPVKLAGQHRLDGSPGRRSFRSDLVDLTKPRHVRPAQFGWNS